MQFALHKAFIVKTVEIEDADVTLDTMLLSKRDTILKQIDLPFDKLLIRKIDCENMQLTIRSAKGSKEMFTGIQKLIVTGLSSERILKDGYHFKEMQCRLSNFVYTLKAGLHGVRIKDIEVDSKKESVVLHHVRVVPMFKRSKFFSTIGHQADMVQAEISKIEIAKFDLLALFRKKFVAEKINIYAANVHIFRDRRYPRLQKDIPLPMEAFRKAPFDIRVKIVQLSPSTVAYEEQPAEGNQTGTLRIEKLTFSISPLDNHFSKSGPDYLRMKTQGSVMGTGNVEATVLMPLKPGMPYHVKGIFNKVELTRLNASSENLGKIRIKSGFLDFLYFQFKMSDKMSEGKIIGAYHHLVIQQLKRNAEEKKVQKFSSFMLRNFIIPLNKPASLPERRRTGTVHYQRDPSRFFSYYLLQSLLTGVKSSFALGFLLPK